MPYNVYIDESGDIGFGTGTRWFVLAAVAVKESDEANIRKTLNAIKTKFNLKTIHWRRIKDFYRRAYITRAITEHDFVYVNIIADTSKIERSKIPNGDMVYNYMCRYLIERISWIVRDAGETATITLSSRGTAKDKELVEYIKKSLIKYPYNQVADVFTTVTYKSASEWDMLQLADICAATTFGIYEPGMLGFTVPCHAIALSDKLYTHNGSSANYGIKYFPDESKPENDYLRSMRICYKKRRTPSATTT